MLDESKLFGTLLGIQKISCLRVGFVFFDLKIIDLKIYAFLLIEKNYIKKYKNSKMVHIIFLYVILSKYATITIRPVIMRTKV